MSARFTKGPWQTAPNFPRGMTAIIDCDGRTKPYTLIAKAEKARDARLIAKAPEMFALLADCEESFTADDSYKALRDACRRIIAEVESDERRAA